MDCNGAAQHSTAEAPQLRRIPWWCWLLLAAAVCAVSSAGVAFSYMLDVPALTLAAWRLQLTTVITAIAAAFQWQGMTPEHRTRFKGDHGWTLFSGLCLAVHFAAWVWSLQHTSLAHSLLLVSTTPIILVGVALVTRQAISTGEVLSAVLAVAGCAVLAGGAAIGREQHVTLLGDAAAVLAALAIVGHWHAGKLLRTYQPVFVYGAPVTGIAAVTLTFTGFATERRTLVGPDNHGIVGWLTSVRYAPFVMYLGVVPGIVGHAGFNTVLKYMSPLMVSLAVQFEPVIGPFLGWLAGVAAAPGTFTWIGGGIVLLATAGAIVATAKRQQAEAGMVKHKFMQLLTQDNNVQGGERGMLRWAQTGTMLDGKQDDSIELGVSVCDDSLGGLCDSATNGFVPESNLLLPKANR